MWWSVGQSRGCRGFELGKNKVEIMEEIGPRMRLEKEQGKLEVISRFATGIKIIRGQTLYLA